MQNDDTKITVLVVDDSNIIRQYLRNFFISYNIDVVTCNNGLDGIEKAVEYKPVLIFLDLMMPNLDGIKMLQVIKRLDNIKNIPVIVISGNTNRSNVLASIESGAEKVISKPLRKELIIKSVNEILGDDFLNKYRKGEVLPSLSTDEITDELCRLFLKGYPFKRDAMIESLLMKDKEKLRNIAHEIKGAGSTIGFPRLTELGASIESEAEMDTVDWPHVTKMCDEMFAFIDEIEKSLSIIE